MSDRSVSTVDRFDAAPLERRRGVDRRNGRDRRVVDLWREIGRGFDLRAGIERRSGQDRRRHAPGSRVEADIRRPGEILVPWQIAEPPAG